MRRLGLAQSRWVITDGGMYHTAELLAECRFQTLMTTKKTTNLTSPPTGTKVLSDKVEHFTESVIREMTRQAMLYGAINLAQGLPDFPAPEEIKRAAQKAIAADIINRHYLGREEFAPCDCAKGAATGTESPSIRRKRLRCAAERPRLWLPLCWRLRPRRRGRDLRALLRKLPAGFGPLRDETPVREIASASRREKRVDFR